MAGDGRRTVGGREKNLKPAPPSRPTGPRTAGSSYPPLSLSAPKAPPTSPAQHTASPRLWVPGGYTYFPEPATPPPTTTRHSSLGRSRGFSTNFSSGERRFWHQGGLSGPTRGAGLAPFVVAATLRKEHWPSADIWGSVAEGRPGDGKSRHVNAVFGVGGENNDDVPA